MHLAMEAIGVSRFHYMLLILCGMSWACYYIWIQGLSALGPRIQDDFDVSDAEMKHLPLILFLGMFFGALFWGCFADRYGRGIPYVLCIALASISGFSLVFSPSYTFLCILLFPLGFFITAFTIIDATYLAEFLPRSRQSLILLMGGFYSMGGLVLYLASLFIPPSWPCSTLPEDPEESSPNPPCTPSQRNGWRLVFLVCTMLQCLLFLARLLFCRVRESPLYLMNRGKYSQAARVLIQVSKDAGHAVPPAEVQGFAQAWMDPDHLTALNLEQAGVLGKMGGSRVKKSVAFAPTLVSSLGEEEGESSVPSSSSSSPLSSLSSTASPRLTSMDTVITGNPTCTSPTSILKPRQSAGVHELSRVSSLISTAIHVHIYSFFIAFGSFILILYLPTYLEYQKDREGLLVEMNAFNTIPSTHLLLSTLVCFPGSFATKYLVTTYLDWKGTFTLGFLITSLSFLLLPMASIPIMRLISLCSIHFSSIMLYTILGCYIIRAFPPSLRTRIGGTSGASQHLAILLVLTMGGPLTAWGSILPFLLAAGLMLAGAFTTLMLPSFRTPDHV